MLIASLLGLMALAGNVESGGSDAAINRAVREYNQTAVFALPTFDDDQLQDLAQGEVVRIVERDDDRSKPARALAFKLSSHSMEALWVASLDPHLTVDPDLTERKLSRTGDRELWYGYYELPYPFSDRHWLVESWNNRALAEATSGRAWEHAWTLANGRMDEARDYVATGAIPGVDHDAMDRAILTPHNHGAWLVIRLPDGRSLLGYHATSTVGGSVPDWVVLQLLHGRLQALLERVDGRCPTLVIEHYTAAHPDLEGGNGAPLRWRPAQHQ